MAVIFGGETKDNKTGTAQDDLIVGGRSGATYTNAVANLVANDVAVSGYVYSSYGERSAQEINQDIWLMKENFAGMASVFIDEVSGSHDDLATYQAVVDYAHSLGLKVIFNPGTLPEDSAYIALGDVTVVGENAADVSAAMATARDMGYTADKIAGLEYAIPGSSVLANTTQLFERGAGYAYVTEDGASGGNPWDSLSSYFAEQVAIAENHGGQVLLPLYVYPDTLTWDVVAAGGAAVTAIVNPNNGPQTGDDKLHGGSGNDTLMGFEGLDKLYGDRGDDILYGGSGNDTLRGGVGNDVLVGGSGKDALIGGAGSDLFVFNTLAESGYAKSDRDQIRDFKRGQDLVDLRSIDADSTIDDDQSFGVLIGARATFHEPGELRFSGGVLYGNTDYDAAPEFSIGLSGVGTLSLTDFLL